MDVLDSHWPCFTPPLHGYHGSMRVGTGNHVDRANPLCLNYPTTKGPEPRFGSTVRQWSRQVDLSTLSCLFNRNPKTSEGCSTAKRDVLFIFGLMLLIAGLLKGPVQRVILPILQPFH